MSDGADYNDWIEQQQSASPPPLIGSPGIGSPGVGAPRMLPADYGFGDPAGGAGGDPVGGALGEVQARIAQQQQARAQQAAAYDPANFRPDPDAEAISAAPPPAKHGALADFARETWISTLQTGQAAIGAVSAATRALGADPDTVAHIERVKADVANYAQSVAENLSPEAQTAMHASLFGGTDAQGQAIPTPGQAGWGRYFGANVAGLIPQIALAVLPGTVAARFATKVAMSVLGAEAGTAAASTAAKIGMVAGAATTGGTFGALDAGQAYNDLTREIDGASDQELMGSPAYAAKRNQGVSEQDAKRTLVGIIAPAMVAAHFGVGALAGAGLGGLLAKGAAGAAGRGLLARAGIGAAEGAATMGAQSGADTALDQSARMQAGTQQGFDASEIARAVASGAIGGAVLGAGGGMLHGGHPETAAPAAPVVEQPAAPVGPDETAALKAALPATPTPTYPGGQGDLFGQHQQGEMFAPAEMGQAPQEPAIRGLQPGMAGGAAQGDLFDPANPPPPPPAPVQQSFGFGASPPPETPADPNPAKLPPNPPAATAAAPSVEPPASVTPVVTPPAKPLSRAEAIRQLVAAGQPKKGLAGLKLAELQERVDALKDARPAPADPVAPAPADPVAPAPAAPAPVASAESTPPAEPAATPVGAAAPVAELVQAAEPTSQTEAAAQGAAATAARAHAAADRLRNASPEDLDTIAANAAAIAADPNAKPIARAVAAKASRALGKRETKAPEGLPETAPGLPEAPAGQTAPEVPPATPAKPLTKGEELRARRAAEKARQAAAAAPVEKPAAYVAPETPEGDQPTLVRPGRVARTHAEAMQDVRDALEYAGKQVVPLKKGGLSEVLSRAMREISDIAAKKDETEGGVHEAVAQWGRADSNPIPGSKTRRFPVADQMLKILTDEGLDERARETARRQIAGEAARQPSHYESEGVARRNDREDRDAGVTADAAEDEAGIGTLADTTRESAEAAAPRVAEPEEGEEPSQGVTNYGSDAEKEYAKATTDLKRIGEYALNRVLAGTLSPDKAHEAFGVQKPGTKPRRWADFAAFLDHKIAEAESPEGRKALLDNLIRTQDAEGASKAERREIVQADPDYAQRLRDIRDELRAQQADPVGHAVAQEAAKPSREELRQRLRNATARREAEAAATKRAKRWQAETAGAKPAEPAAPLQRLLGRARQDGLAPEASRYVRAAADPRVNADVERAMRASERHDVPFTTRDLLRTIVNSGLARAELRPLRELAARLAKVAPDLPVMSYEHAEEHGYATGAEEAGGRNYLGVTMRDAQGRATHIILDHDNFEGQASQHVEVALHEILHSVTGRYLDHAMQNGHSDAHLLTEIMRELARHAAADPGALERLGLDPEALNDAALSPHEAHTMLLSNPSLQAWASSRQASPEFRDAMRNLGYPVREPGRSIWRYFTDWVRRALGMGPVGSASEQTLMDHLLRPAQDIADRAVGYNRMTRDPVVRAMGEPLLRGLGGRLGDAGGDVLRRLDPQGLGDRAVRALLTGAPTDGIIRWNRTLFEPSKRLALDGNPLEHYRSAQEAIAAVARGAHEADADQVNGLVSALRADPAHRLGQLMNDATLARAHLGDVAPDANAHLTSDEDRARLAELQARHLALTPEERATYAAVRDLGARWYRQERDARLGALIRTYLPDLTEAQRGEITQALRTRRSTEAFLARSDSHPLAAALGSLWHGSGGTPGVARLVRGIAKVHAMGFVQGDYFPLRRFGDYVLRYGARENGDYGVERFERRSDAEARRLELARQDVGDLSPVMSARDSQLREVLPDHPIVAELEQAMRARPGLAAHAGDVEHLLKSLLLDHASRSERTRTAMRRQGVAGASADAGRVLAQEFLSHGVRLGYLTHGPARAQALARMDMVAGDLERHGTSQQAITARSVMRELQLRSATGDEANNVLQGLARRASSLGFVQSLLSPSHMLTSSIETHMNSAAMLGARHGAKPAALALSRALAEVSPRLLRQGAAMSLKAVGKGLRTADWNLAHAARDRLIARGADAAAMRDLFDRAGAAGLIDHTMVREMQRIAGGFGTTGVGNAWQRFMDLNAAGAHAVDVANKSAVLKAAYDLERRKPRATHETAANYAVETLRQVTPNYNLANKARVTTSRGFMRGWAGPATQFKQYGIHMYSVMANLTRESLHGATPEERRVARKALAGVLATHALMAGSLTLLADPLRYVGGAYDLATGADRPHDYQNDVRGFLSDVFGPELGEIVARGVPHAVGIDLHRRVGLANLLELPDLDGFTKEGVLKALGTAMTGASVSDAGDMVQGVSRLLQGDLLGGIKGLVPRPVRDVMKAIDLADRGVADPRGHTILPASQLGAGAVAAQAAGFQPSAVSEAREGRGAVLEARQEAQTDRTRLTDAWVRADPADRAAVMSEIRQWNMANPGLAITVDQLVRRLQEQRRGANGANFGLRLPPKAARQLVAAGRFAQP